MQEEAVIIAEEVAEAETDWLSTAPLEEVVSTKQAPV